MDVPPPPDASPTVSDGPLKGLPSQPGPHIAQIEALGDGEWLELGIPAADPTYGPALGRSWGGRALILAEALRGAFFFGEGEHAYVKPDGYAMDDLWFYDINQNRWITVYPGLHIASFNDRVASGELKVDANRQIIDKNGNFLPIHTKVHAWDSLSYDTKRHRFTWMAGDGMTRYFLPGEKSIEQGVATLEAQREAITSTSPMSPWYYDVASNAFRRDVIGKASTPVGDYSAFLYLPDQDRFINAGSGGVQLFDPNSLEWTRVSDKGPRPPGYDHGVAYDRHRKRLYMGPGDNSSGLYIYDLSTETWTVSRAEGGPSGFRTNDASAQYDEVNDVLTILHYIKGLAYTYKPDTDEWSSTPIPKKVFEGGYQSYHGFYDTKLNAYFVYHARNVPHDAPDNGVMWVYRYHKAK